MALVSPYAHRTFGGCFASLDTGLIENAQGLRKAPCSLIRLERREMMPVKLCVRDDLSINDIAKLGRTHTVKVTPHVGNWTPARMVLPTLGISVLCVDHTIGAKDRNAHPHLLIHNGEAHALCDDVERLTTHSRVTRKANSGRHPIGASLSDVHVGTLRALYPAADILTHCEDLKRQQDIVLKVLEEVTRHSPAAAWWRRVNEEGGVTCYRRKDLPSRWEEYMQSIFPLTDERQGWLIHNRVCILLDVILQSRMGTESEIYHLSGPDMVRYLGGEIETISRLYDHVRRCLGLKQERIVFNLVPFASFRFATRASQSPACDRICEEFNGSARADVLRTNLEGARDIFSETETQRYFTQHDYFMSGEGIVLPEIAKAWSMAKCAAYLETLRSL